MGSRKFFLACMFFFQQIALFAKSDTINVNRVAFINESCKKVMQNFFSDLNQLGSYKEGEKLTLNAMKRKVLDNFNDENGGIYNDLSTNSQIVSTDTILPLTKYLDIFIYLNGTEKITNTFHIDANIIPYFNLLDPRDTDYYFSYKISKKTNIEPPNEQSYSLDNTLYITFRVKKQNDELSKLAIANISDDLPKFSELQFLEVISDDFNCSAAYFRIVKYPSNARLQIDDDSILHSNNEIFKISHGQHKISYLINGVKKKESTININKDRIYDVVGNLNSYLTVSSNVSSSEIYVDDNYVGYGKIVKYAVTPGHHIIDIKARRYIPEKKLVYAEKGKEYNYKIKIRKINRGAFLRTVTGIIVYGLIGLGIVLVL